MSVFPFHYHLSRDSPGPDWVKRGYGNEKTYTESFIGVGSETREGISSYGKFQNGSSSTSGTPTRRKTSGSRHHVHHVYVTSEVGGTCRKNSEPSVRVLPRLRRKQGTTHKHSSLGERCWTIHTHVRHRDLSPLTTSTSGLTSPVFTNMKIRTYNRITPRNDWKCFPFRRET